jgi:hypothetical protein
MAAKTERDNLISRLPLRTNGGTSMMSFTKSRELFAAISTETIREMSSLRGVLLSDALTGIQHCEWDETILRDYCRLCHIDALKFTRVQHLTDRLASLQFYEHLTPQQEGYYPEERVSQATAILTVVAHQKLHGIEGWHVTGSAPKMEYYPYIDDAKLRELLLTSDYDRDVLVNLIVERNIFDGEELARIIGSAHPALVDGAL